VDYVSIENQRLYVEAEAERRGFVCEWYEDVDRSGRTESIRPRWLALKRRVSDADVAAVLVYRLDRAARSVHDISAFIKDCDRHGVAFITADGIVDTSHGSALRTMFINMLGAVAQLESDLASERMKDYVAGKDKAGLRHGKTPFGTKRVGEGYDAQFEPNEDAAAAVRCLQVYAAGMSYDTGAAKLNEEGILFRSRNGLPKRWGRESVRTVVGNVLHYAGYHVPNTGWDAKADRIKLTGEGDYVDRWAATLGAWLSPAIKPIIDRSLANAVIERRFKNQIAGRPAADKPYLLAPIATWRGRRLRGRIRPYGRFYATFSGEGVQLDADKSEAFVIDKLAGLQFPPEMVQRIREMLLQRMSADRLAQLKARVDEAERGLSTLADLLLASRISRQDYDRKFDELTREKRSAENELAKPTEVEQSLRMLADLGGMIGLMSPEVQKRNIHRIFTAIELNDEGEAAKVEVKSWVARAFAEIALALEHHEASQTAQTLPKVGIEDDIGVVWLMRVVPVLSAMG
jgi:DNA invertase Pin-like site-specific DNA recombinase